MLGTERLPVRVGIFLVVFTLLLFALLFQRSYTTTLFRQGHDDTPATAVPLNIAVFATSANYHYCQLHMSAALLGYPAYTLLNWQEEDEEHFMKQHAAKLDGALRYLDAIPQDQQDDLVLFLDGFDIWFQLPYEHIVKRYYDVVEQARLRNLIEFGEDVVAAQNISSTVIFAADKMCAPASPAHSQCWGVPDSWMLPSTFGPDADQGDVHKHHRARWLNSGTVIGPVSEVREIFAAAQERNEHEHATDSDQYYFGIIYGLQAYGRRMAKLARDTAMGLDTTAEREFLKPQQADPNKKWMPTIPGRTEYSIGLDFSSAVFQTAGFYADYISWIRNNVSSQYVRQGSLSGNYHHHFAVQDDLVGKGPGALHAGIDAAMKQWSSLPLATNTASRNVAPVFHVNGKKCYRTLWWPRMWWFPYAEQIWNALQDTATEGTGKSLKAHQGAWTFNHEGHGWVDWKDVCGKFEEPLMGKSPNPEPCSGHYEA